MLLEETAEPEELAVGGGELFLELADRGPADIAFAVEFLSKDVRDVVVAGVLRGRLGAGLAFCWFRSFSMRLRRSSFP